MLDNKVAIITGGSSGNGRAIAKKFVENGARVIVADLSEEVREGGEPTVAMIDRFKPGAAKFMTCDVSKTDDLEAVVQAAEDWGGLDIMVNNAGILIKQPILEATEDIFDKMVDVNIKGVYFGSQAAARAMAKRKSGVIINMCSVAGMRGTGGFSHYNMTKGAVRLLTYSLADELGPMGIRVNNVNPGIMRTQMNVEDDPVIGTDTGEGYLDIIPARRWGEPEEVADTCLYLASDLSTYVTGTSLIVDGGLLRI
ncbi:SDR family oxidoreductase [Hoeflea prorocentri]|uniref:SDR family oxidoreductase n=1 Tax=Hoeflea prorocentri TaxID=1922333 RepID=A0A9X3UII3_9HYPH|nr:SDR family oxidoreductase [Hoeflea prorocentri]MCY6379819.1 SDR family oxidoreductase [Hoeflea prorocentri]MDA5397619.1 SDR family oxidoreductase [Hoeflea prorocentri]